MTTVALASEEVKEGCFRVVPISPSSSTEFPSIFKDRLAAAASRECVTECGRLERECAAQHGSLSGKKMPAMRRGCAIFTVSPSHRVRPDDIGEHPPVLGSYKADVLSSGIDRFPRGRTFALGLAGGLTPHQAAVVANVAAGIVRKGGAVTVPAEPLNEALLDGVKRKGRSTAA